MKVIGLDGITNEYEYAKMGDFLVPIAEGRHLEKIFFRVINENSKKHFFESPQAYFWVQCKIMMANRNPTKKQTTKEDKNGKWGDSDSEEERDSAYFSMLKKNKGLIDNWKEQRNSAIRKWFRTHVPNPTVKANLFNSANSFNVQIKN